MKPKKIEKKLYLSKKTIADLSSERMNNIKGGDTSIPVTEITYCQQATCVFTDCAQETCVTCDGTTCWAHCSRKPICY